MRHITDHVKPRVPVRSFRYRRSMSPYLLDEITFTQDEINRSRTVG